MKCQEVGTNKGKSCSHKTGLVYGLFGWDYMKKPNFEKSGAIVLGGLLGGIIMKEANLLRWQKMSLGVVFYMTSVFNFVVGIFLYKACNGIIQTTPYLKVCF